MMEVDGQERFASVNEYVKGVAESLATVVGAVKNHQARASEHQKRYFDFKGKFQYYSVDELVWLKNKVRKKGVSPKLQKRFKGPYRILERVSEVLYRIQPEAGGIDHVVHFNQLKPYVPSMVAESTGGHTTDKADHKTTSAPSRGKKERGPGFGSSWVFRRSRPPDFPVAGGGSHSSASASVTEGFQSVRSPAAAGIPASPGLSAASRDSQTSQLSIEAEVSSASVEVPVVDSWYPPESPVIVREPPLTAGFTVAEGAGRNDLSVAGGKLPTPAISATERGRPLRRRKPPVWFKDYDGPV